MRLITLLLLALFSLAAEAREDSRALKGVLKTKSSSSADVPVDMERDDLVEPIADSTDTASISNSKAGKKAEGSAKKGKKVKSVDGRRGPKLGKTTKASSVVVNGDSEDAKASSDVISGDSEDVRP